MPSLNFFSGYSVSLDRVKLELIFFFLVGLSVYCYGKYSHLVVHRTLVCQRKNFFRSWRKENVWTGLKYVPKMFMK